MYIFVPIGLCGKKFEIMRFMEGKLCVYNI